MYFLLKMGIFLGYVGLPEGISLIHKSPVSQWYPWYQSRLHPRQQWNTRLGGSKDWGLIQRRPVDWHLRRWDRKGPSPFEGHDLYGCFLKWWYPKTQNTPFLVGKRMVVGYHYCRKPPYNWTKSRFKEKTSAASYLSKEICEEKTKTFGRGEIGNQRIQTRSMKILGHPHCRAASQGWPCFWGNTSHWTWQHTSQADQVLSPTAQLHRVAGLLQDSNYRNMISRSKNRSDIWVIPLLVGGFNPFEKY